MSPPPLRHPEATANEVLDAVHNAQDQIASIQGDALHALDVQRAVAQGIRDAVSDPALWSAAVTAMQTHAQKEAGGWLLGMIKGIASKAFLFFVIGLGVYSVGGWSALAALFKTTTHTP